MVGRDVPPFVQLLQIRQPSVIGRINPGHIQGESESVEIFLDIVDIWIPVIQRAIRRKLLLNKNLQRGPHFGGDDLRTLRVEVSAESLEVGREQ